MYKLDFNEWINQFDLDIQCIMSNRNIAPNYRKLYDQYNEPYRACIAFRNQEYMVWKSQVDDLLFKEYNKLSADLTDQPYQYYFSLGKSPEFMLDRFSNYTPTDESFSQ